MWIYSVFIVYLCILVLFKAYLVLFRVILCYHTDLFKSFKIYQCFIDLTNFLIFIAKVIFKALASDGGRL